MSHTITLEEAARMLKTCTETVSACIRLQGLPAAKVGRAWVLVDDDVIDWLRKQYGKGDLCESTKEASAGFGGSIPRLPAGELQKALAPHRASRQRNLPPGLRQKHGEPADSEKSPA